MIQFCSKHNFSFCFPEFTSSDVHHFFLDLFTLTRHVHDFVDCFVHSRSFCRSWCSPVLPVKHREHKHQTILPLSPTPDAVTGVRWMSSVMWGNHNHILSFPHGREMTLSARLAVHNVTSGRISYALCLSVILVVFWRGAATLKELNLTNLIITP